MSLIATELDIREIRHHLEGIYRHDVMILSVYDHLVGVFKREVRGVCMDANLEKFLAAIQVAALKHAGKFRNHADWVPYFTHPMRVAILLITEGQISNVELIIAGLLYDVLDGKQTTREEILFSFGSTVFSLLEEVVDDMGDSFTQKLKGMSREAKILKLADNIHNLRDLIEHPPEIWRKDKVADFIEYSLRILDALKGTHLKLEDSYIDALENLKRVNQI